MKIALTFGLILGFSANAFGHGVERGTIWDILRDEGIEQNLATEVVSAIQANCRFDSVSKEFRKISHTIRAIDQGSVDHYFQIHLMASRWDRTESIVVDAANYDISNPTVKNVEVLSISSPLCN